MYIPATSFLLRTPPSQVEPPTLPAPILPDVVFPPKPTRNSLSRTVKAADGVIPVGYGRFMTNGHLGPVTEYNGELVICMFFCWGECEEIEQVYINDELPPSDVTINKYTGTTSQTADSLLAAAITDFSETYVLTVNNETRGICYCVVSVPEGSVAGFPRVSAIIKGMKVYVPGSGTFGTRSTYDYSTNPCYCMADFCESSLYGAGLNVAADTSTLYDADDYCDDATLGETRRIIGLSLDNTTDTTSWLETLRAYAGCIMIHKAGVVYFIPDKATSSTSTFTADNIVGTPLTITKKGSKDTPNVVRVNYTDTTKIPWRTATATAKLSGVDAGTLPWRESVVSLPGISRYSQAYREAVERLNASSLTDIGTRLTVFDEGMEVVRGDVITVTHPIGLTAKQFRVLDMTAPSLGRWVLDLYEYDAAVYSDAIETTPSTPDTTLPDPSDLPTVTNLTLSESVFQRRDGTWASRIAASWDDVSLRAGALYRVNVYAGGVLYWTSTTSLTEINTPEVTELQQYTVEVYAEMQGFTGTEDTEDITPAGKYAIPGDVPSIDGFETGGEVRLWWSAAVDIDIWRYEIRYSGTSGSWSTATVYDVVDGLRATLKDIPEGTWRFFIKAIDSIEQESETAAYVDLDVTIDYNAYLIDVFSVENPTLTNVHSYELNRYDGDTHYTMDTAVTWATEFPNAMSTYTKELASYFDNLAGVWLSEVLDFGAEYSGSMLATVPVDELDSSTVTVTLETSKDASGVITGGTSPITSGSGAIPSGSGAGTWTTESGLSVKTTARYARVRIVTTAGNTFHCKIPGINVRFSVIIREETGSVTTSASAATTVSLSNDYEKVKSIAVVPQGTTPITVTYNNVSISGSSDSFDIYAFNTDTGAQVAVTVYWHFQGV